jgi:protocatechuate 3,4-dioxygenase beta subunit
MVNSCVANMSSSSEVVFAAFISGSAPRPTTRPATLGRAFSLHGAVADTIAPPMVNSCVSNMSSSSGVVYAAFIAGSAPRPTTRPATLGRAFSLHGAVEDTIATPYVSSMLLLHIRMLSIIFRSPVASAFSLFVPCTWQTSTGFRRVGESGSTALLHLRLYLMLKP